MKSFIAAAFMMISFSAFASDYQCFSYNTGKQVIASTDSGVIVVKDRFGNELNTILDAGTNIRILATIPETLETQFIKNDEIVMIIQAQGESIRALFEADESFLCRVRKPFN